MRDDFFNDGMATAMNREYMRGFEKGYETCMQVLTGVMKASLDNNNLITSSSHLTEIANKVEMPETSKALAVAIHIAADKKTFGALQKENAEPLSASAVKMLMQELEDFDSTSNPLSALAGYRNKPPKWN